MRLWMRRHERNGSSVLQSLAGKVCVSLRSRRSQDRCRMVPPFQSLTFLGLAGLEDPPQATFRMRYAHASGLESG